MKIEQIIKIAHATKYWTKGDGCTVIDNGYLPEFVEACHQAKLQGAKTFEYIHSEELGGGVFDIVRLPDGKLFFSFLDKHGIFNVFPTMEDYTLYAKGLFVGFKRECFEDVQLDEGDPNYEEGVDALDRYLRKLV